MAFRRSLLINKNYFFYELIAYSAGFEVIYDPLTFRYTVTAKTQTYNSFVPSPLMPFGPSNRIKLIWESNLDIPPAADKFERESFVSNGNLREAIGYWKAGGVSTDQIFTSYRWAIGSWITRLHVEYL